MSKREYESTKAIAKQLEKKTGNKQRQVTRKKSKVLNIEFTI
jgi:hypothetical protein